jgi:hypothetical protein
MLKIRPQSNVQPKRGAIKLNMMRKTMRMTQKPEIGHKTPATIAPKLSVSAHVIGTVMKLTMYGPKTLTQFAPKKFTVLAKVWPESKVTNMRSTAEKPAAIMI